MNEMPIIAKDWNTPTPVGGIVPFHRDAKGQVAPAEIGRQFEQIFVQQLMHEMSKSIDGGFFGESSGSHVYQGLFESVIADKITSQKGGIGIAPAVEKSLGNQMMASAPERLFRPGKPSESAGGVQ